MRERPPTSWPWQGPRDQGATVPTALLALFAAIWLALAFDVGDRQDWALENALVWVSVPILVFTYRSLRFSNFSYALLFVFFVLHEIGAHYTYSEVPYDEWWLALTGDALNATLGLERNHYDRVIHFAYGLMMVPPTLELLDAKAPPVGVWRFVVPLFFLQAQAGLYELIEWLAAEVFGGELGQAYLGTQGDIWDAHKDMALAGLGTIIALSLCLVARRR